MLHGMTGTSAMMQPFAQKICPEGWTLLVPEGRFEHPKRGKSWWRYENWDADVTRRRQLSRVELMDVDSSISQIEELLSTQLFVDGVKSKVLSFGPLLALPIQEPLS